ncbi:bacterial regulatory helix-turn-helix, lysR family protein [Lysobacter capsici]|uniref:LysR family transcriptional regulator n=1 Tax=Lysobacter capsici TaxID=435897 RepID=UPI000722EE3B|nr:LysR family transcriptional regulator [Lysobacter capsici]ALN88077.1 bacterial regulatory helix-turn-helix, lysR family protein [Lysobacter capsici]
MELRHIRYFLAVAEERNFTRAAERLGIGQPPLSQQIRDLETQIGARLFHRVPHGAELTDAGRAFLERVRTLPEQAHAAVRQAQRAARGETGALRLGFTSSAILAPLTTGAIRDFRRRYPDVELTLEEGNSAHLSAKLRDGSLDLAFLRPDGSENDDMRLYPLLDEAMIAALPSAHPAARDSRRKSIRLTELREDALILTPRTVGPTLHDAIVGACRHAGFEPRLGQHAPQLASSLALVAAELGVSIVPEAMRRFALPGIVYRDIAGLQPIARLALAHLLDQESAQTKNFVALTCAGGPPGQDEVARSEAVVKKRRAPSGSRR